MESCTLAGKFTITSEFLSLVSYASATPLGPGKGVRLTDSRTLAWKSLRRLRPSRSARLILARFLSYLILYLEAFSARLFAHSITRSFKVQLNLLQVFCSDHCDVNPLQSSVGDKRVSYVKGWYGVNITCRTIRR